MKDALFDLLWGRCQKYQQIIAAFGGPAKIVQYRLDKHHICGGKSRLDVPSNLIELRRPSHDFCHHHPVIGKVACIYVVSQREDFSWDEIDRAAGLSVRGWLESKLDSMLKQGRDFVLYAKFAERILDDTAGDFSRTAKRNVDGRSQRTPERPDRGSD